MSPTPTQNPQYFKRKIDTILDKVDKLEGQTEFTERDVAIAADLVQQYIDVLGEMERTHISYDDSITVNVSDKTLKFATTEMFVNWLDGVMR